MELTAETRGSVTVLRVKGNLTIATAQDFFTGVIGLLEKGEHKLLIDAAELEAIDSIGLGTVVRVSKRARQAGAKLRLANLKPSVMQVFQLTKLDRALELYANDEQALEGL